MSYSRPAVIGPVTDLVDPIPGSNFRNDSFLSLASDPAANSTTLYAAWVNRTAADGSAAELVVYRTTGAGWSKVATTVHRLGHRRPECRSSRASTSPTTVGSTSAGRR